MQLTIKERILPAEREWIGKVKIRIRKKCQSLCSDLLQDLEVNICWLWGSVVGGGGVFILYIHTSSHCGYYRGQGSFLSTYTQPSTVGIMSEKT